MPFFRAWLEEGCEGRGDAAVRAIDGRVKAAEDADWDTEYLDSILSARVVDGLSEAMSHINTHGSHHTDAIVTENAEKAEAFLNGVEPAMAMWNASSQFATGGEFGLGAEIGIPRGSLHPRGPAALHAPTPSNCMVGGERQTA